MKSVTILTIASAVSALIVPLAFPAFATQAGSDVPASAVKGKDRLAPYPKADPGYQRIVIHLPPNENEADQRVELMIGKTLEVDCNRQWFAGDLKEKQVTGWGYSYYVLEKMAGPASTMMACPGRRRHEAFVQLRGDGYLVRYNSKLPLVVYAPDGFEVRYRVWRAGNEIHVGRPE